MIVARRVYLYGIAFATLWVLINGIAGLMTVALEAVVEAALGPFMSFGTSNVTDRVSLYGALTGIGLVMWAIHWGLAARAVTRDSIGERRSAIRKLYLYGVVLVGGLIVLYQLRELLSDLFGLAFGVVGRSDLVGGDVVPPLAMLAATGAFWLYHIRQAQRDRMVVPEVGAGATLRRWCVYVLAAVGLMLLLFGAADLLERLVDVMLPVEAESSQSGRWLAFDMAGRLSTVLAGLIAWVAAWGWSTRLFTHPEGPDPDRDSTLRKVYLYGVLLVVVTWTVWSLAEVLYVLVRSVLLPGESRALWSMVQSDLGETAGNLLVFGLAWIYHAHVLKREAAAAPERQRQANIRWIYGYIVALVGAATFGSGLVGTIATVLDLLVQSDAVHAERWWEERLSIFVTLIVVGIPVWLLPWLRLQREVSSAVARRSLARRVYLFLALGVTVLTLLGSGAYTLYQLLRVLLGERWTGSDTSSLIDAGSAAFVAVLLLAYHLRVFQHDAALAKQDEAATPVPAPPATPADTALPDTEGDVVTLLVARAASAEEAGALKARIEAALPPGTAIETLRVSRAEAERLLQS